MSDGLTPSTFEAVFQTKKGMLLVDKPVGPTSHDLVAWARKVFRVRKIGHTGTLDPLASGLLILLVGREFTKLQIQLLKQEKTYLVTAEMGVTSNTFDKLGKMMKSRVLNQPTDNQLRTTLNEFLGEIDQEVPAFSAVKIGGKKLYNLARRKNEVLPVLPSRRISIRRIDLIEYSWPFVSLRIDCSSGTYVRSLVNDLGKKLGVGAVVFALRRERIGLFDLGQAAVCPYFISTDHPLLGIETNRGETRRQ